MSEQDRARLYDWLREQAGEQEAEYLMSCIASVPLTELATKDSVERLEQRFDAELPKLATKDSVEAVKTSVDDLKTSMQRLEAVCVGLEAKFEAERLRRDEQRLNDRDRLDEQRVADRREAAEQRDADSAIAGKRHKLLVGAAILIAAEIVAAEAGWLRWFTEVLGSVL